MTIEELKLLMAARVDLLLKELHFSSFDGAGVFAKQGSMGVFDLYALVVQDADQGLRISPNVGIRHEKVEEIFHRTSLWDRRLTATTPTFGTSLGLLRDGDMKRPDSYLIHIGSEQEIDGALAEISWIHKTYAIPYYQKYGSLKEVDAALNEKPGEISIHCLVPWLHWSTGIIVAKLVDRSNYTQLADYYTQCAKRSNKGFYWSRFESLLKDLEANVTPLV